MHPEPTAPSSPASVPSWPRLRLLVASCVALVAMGLASAQPGVALDRLGVDVRWSSISLDTILRGGPPPQGIPALGFRGDRAGAARPSPEPRYIAVEEATWIEAREPVIVVELNGETRVYPLQILTWHEIVNDTLGDVPIAVTFCPLCNSALAFDRRVGLDPVTEARARAAIPDLETLRLPASWREVHDAQGPGPAPEVGIDVTFGVSGLLVNSNLLMFDDRTNTLWTQLLGEGVVGTLTGVRLLRYPAPIVAFEAARAEHPDATVVSRQTGFSRAYGTNPYVGYDAVDTPAFLFRGPADGRLPPKARVAAVAAESDPVAYPFDALNDLRVVNDAIADRPVVVFWTPGTRSALDTSAIAAGRDVGAVTIFERTVDGRVLTFEPQGDTFVDVETGTTWNLFGTAIEGELAGARLTPVAHEDTLWFAWAAFRPDTRVYGLEARP